MHKMCYLYLHILCSTAISRSFMSCRLEDILIFLSYLCACRQNVMQMAVGRKNI